MDSEEVKAAKAKLAARFGGAKARIGGRGTMRRKKKAAPKAASTDDKRLQATLKRLAVTNIPAIEEVNLFQEDGNVIHFENPRVQASIQANTYVVSGTADTKPLQELLPGILHQLGPDNLMSLKKIADTMGKAAAESEAAAAGGDDDEEPPELVEDETFEDAADK